MPLIAQHTIDKVFEAADIESVVSQFVDLKKSGSSLKAKSPFTDEKTPSFYVVPSKNIFKCFSSDKGGGPITFLQEHKQMSFVEAIKYLAELYSIPVDYEQESEAQKEDREKREHYFKIREAAVAKYIKARKELPDDHPAHSQLSRFTEDSLQEWKIGVAPDTGKYIYDLCREKGLVQDAHSAGLLSQSNGQYYDHQRDRITFPIYDHNERLVGLSGRIYKKEHEKKYAKYLNSNSFSKDQILFGLHLAKKSIHQKEAAILCEGFTDVIALHEVGMTNAVCSMGASLSTTQAKLLARYAKKEVIILRDGDEAGMNAAKKDMQTLLKEGLKPTIVVLDKIDPYDLCHHMEIDDPAKYLKENKQDALIHFATNLIIESKDDPKAKGDALKSVASWIGCLEEEYWEVYIEAISSNKTLGVSKENLRKILKKVDDAKVVRYTGNERYQMPSSVNEPIEKFISDIEKYGLFMANNQIWMQRGSEPPFSFQSISNFSIEIIQHMYDENKPAKLVRVKNVAGREKIFDVLSDSMNTINSFDNAVTAHGNYLLRSRNQQDFQKLRECLFDKMGNGEKIEILGWHPSGFFVWNNAITIPGKPDMSLDENGIFRFNDVSFYVPSANKVYRNNRFKYEPQKKVKLIEPRVSFSSYTSQMLKVHRSHAINAILFSVSSVFIDIIEKAIGNFPLLFLYGVTGSGKDQLIDCCQSLFGDKQSAIQLGSKASTAKAQIRKFAQFRNMIVHLSEYRPGHENLDEMLKGFWDRRGYERGTIDSSYGTETVPVTSSVIFTANHYPNDDALITRFLAEEMNKTEFSDDEKAEYQKLRDLTDAGISGFTREILQLRSIWEKDFLNTYRKVENELRKDLKALEIHDRLIGNVSVLGACFHLLKDHFQLPFSYADFLDHNSKLLSNQMKKLNTSSLISKWWDLFLSSVRSPLNTGPLKNGSEFLIKDKTLYINFKACFLKITKAWWSQYQETAPSKSKLIDLLESDSSFKGRKNSHYFSREVKTSAYEFDLMLTGLEDELHEAIEWQKQNHITQVETNKDTQDEEIF